MPAFHVMGKKLAICGRGSLNQVISMSYFWRNLFEYYKERRLAALFFGALMSMGALLAVGCILFQVIRAFDLEGYRVYVLPVLALILCVWIGRGISRERARWRNRYRSSPLSCDELSKARSKLRRAKC